MSPSSWIDQPQRSPLRRAILKIHLWLALAIGIYVIMISLTGAAIVFRPEISRWAIPRTVPDASGVRAEGEALEMALRSAYPDDEIVRFREGRFPRQPVDVLLLRDGEERGRLFDPYALEDMGSDYPPVVAFTEWLVSLHDDLLTYPYGRRINGVAGGIMLIIVVSGLVLWWPGRRHWHRSLYVPLSSRRKIWHLHSAIGIWVGLLLLNWCITSIYFGFPGPFEDLRDWLDTDQTDFDRPGEGLVTFLVDAHFGRFGGVWGRTGWVLLGLTPAVLFISGFWVWLRPRLKQRSGRELAADTVEEPVG